MQKKKKSGRGQIFFHSTVMSFHEFHCYVSWPLSEGSKYLKELHNNLLSLYTRTLAIPETIIYYSEGASVLVFILFYMCLTKRMCCVHLVFADILFPSLEDFWLSPFLWIVLVWAKPEPDTCYELSDLFPLANVSLTFHSLCCLSAITDQWSSQCDWVRLQLQGFSFHDPSVANLNMLDGEFCDQIIFMIDLFVCFTCKQKYLLLWLWALHIRFCTFLIPCTLTNDKLCEQNCIFLIQLSIPQIWCQLLCLLPHSVLPAKYYECVYISLV